MRRGADEAGTDEAGAEPGADEAGDGAAHGAAEPADDARTNPLVGLFGRLGGEGCGLHRANIMHKTLRMSSQNS